ncbi:hypothetical protein E5CHR_05319 [Variovorax sp. PBL-E5]|nr:hypothetical protein E5CHR_05319 [Variovorax sp. PBL-E5]
MPDSKAPHASRRQALKLLSAAPMLPLGGIAFLTACGGGGGGSAGFPPIAPAPVPAPAPAPGYVSAEFTGMAAPSLSKPEAIATTTVGSTLKIAFDDGSAQEFRLAYQPFFITGDAVPTARAARS